MALPFRDFDGPARMTLAGHVVALVAFALPWATVRLSLQVVEFGGTGMAAAPLLLDRIGAPVPLLDALLVAVPAAAALVCAIGGFLLVLAPALSPMRDLNPRAGKGFAGVGLAGALVSVLAMLLLVGPQVGVTQATYGAFLALAGFALALYAWPRGRRVDDEAAAEHAPTQPS